MCDKIGFMYVLYLFSIFPTNLHNVIDQWVSEHPVQVDALVFKDVLWKNKLDFNTVKHLDAQALFLYKQIIGLRLKCTNMIININKQGH